MNIEQFHETESRVKQALLGPLGKTEQFTNVVIVELAAALAVLLATLIALPVAFVLGVGYVTVTTLTSLLYFGGSLPQAISGVSAFWHHVRSF